MQTRNLTRVRLLASVLARCMLVLAGVALSVAVTSRPGAAATLYILDRETVNDSTALFFTPVCNAKLEGVIGAGDFAGIKAKHDAFMADPETAAIAEGQAVFALCLSSPGGDLAVAMQLAELFRTWMRVVEEGDSCISACAILFMKSERRDLVFHGTDFYSSGYAGRFLHHRGKLGFHAPRLVVPQGQPLTRELVAEQYALALRTVRTVLLTGEDSRQPATLAELQASQKNFSFVGAGGPKDDQIPFDLFIAFLTTPPDEIYEISTIEEAMNWGIEIYGFPPPKAVTADMLMTACINVANLRCGRAVGGNQCPDGFEQYTTRHFSAADPDIDTNYGPSLADAHQGWKSSKQTLWPAAGRKPAASDQLTIQAFKVGDAEGATRLTPCVIAATWNGDRLYDLEIQTFNGRDTGWLGSTLVLTDEDISPIREDIASALKAGRDGPHHLRPWKMLPAGTKLTQLGTSGWGWLDDGSDYFDQAPNW